MKKRLDSAKGKWAEELSHVLWAYRTTHRRSTGEILSSMTFGIEAVIPVEVGLSSMRIVDFSPSINDTAMIEKINFMKENREIASIKC